MGYIIGVDSGGTFTDTVAIDEEGRITTSKAPSTPKDFSRGVFSSVQKSADLLGISTTELLSHTLLFAHGTTVATNALLTRTGSKVGHITTKGFEDTLMIGRVHQKVAGLKEDEATYIVRLDKPDPIVPRTLVKGVTERVDYKGEVVVPLNVKEVQNAVEQLVKEGVEAIAVCLLWSFMNPRHERKIAEVIKDLASHVSVTLSADLAPVMKEYERAATTVINAYLGTSISRYLTSLETLLTGSSYTGPLIVMQSSGGVMSVDEAGQKAITTLSSGPVGGVIGAKSLGNLLDHKNVIATDVGGTSFDVGLIVGGEPEFNGTPVFSGYHTSIPAIDTVSIGAGGGSIAWVEPLTNILKVGPRSAGAEPGPVCYDAGGEEPTVTDADVILNRVNPDYFLGGTIKLNKDKATKAMKEMVAKPLALNVTEAAMGVVDIVDAHMADLVRKVTVGRGYDPRNFVLFAYGGAGPTHVAAYSADIGVKCAVVPLMASVFSAYGIAGSDITYLREISDPMIVPLSEDKLNTIYARLEGEAIANLRRDGIKDDSMTISYFIDMRYRGQGHEILVPVPQKKLNKRDLEDVLSSFSALYEQKYGRGTAYQEAGVEAMTYRVRATGNIPKPAPPALSLKSSNPDPALKQQRDVYFKEEKGFVRTNVYARDRLEAGNVIEGPGIVEAVDTNVVIHPRQTARVDEYLNIVLHFE